jgi:hypothetical protein
MIRLIWILWMLHQMWRRHLHHLWMLLSVRIILWMHLNRMRRLSRLLLLLLLCRRRLLLLGSRRIVQRSRRHRFRWRLLLLLLLLRWLLWNLLLTWMRLRSSLSIVHGQLLPRRVRCTHLASVSMATTRTKVRPVCAFCSSCQALQRRWSERRMSMRARMSVGPKHVRNSVAVESDPDDPNCNNSKKENKKVGALEQARLAQPKRAT